MKARTCIGKVKTPRNSARRALIYLISLLSLVLFLPVNVRAQIPGTEGITSLFSLADKKIGAYDAEQRKVRLFSLESGDLKERGAISVDGIVTAMVSAPSGYIFATGAGLAQLAPSIRVFRASDDGKSVQLLYKRVSERSQVTNLLWVQNRVWLGFFDSKYFTKIGFLTSGASAAKPWEFSEVAGMRMGDTFDYLGESLVVGRSYGDSQGEDGDLLLFQKGARILLPSYRGVRAVKLFGEVDNPSIVIADGWHSNYGQVAQARVSLLMKRPGEQRYSLEILDRDTDNYSFNRLFVFSRQGKQRIVATGNGSAVEYACSDGAWHKDTFYRPEVSKEAFEMTLVSAEADVSFFAVIDGGLRFVRREH